MKTFTLEQHQLMNLTLFKNFAEYHSNKAKELDCEQYVDFTRKSFVLEGFLFDGNESKQNAIGRLSEFTNNENLAKAMLTCGGQSISAYFLALIKSHFFSDVKAKQHDDLGSNYGTMDSLYLGTMDNAGPMMTWTMVSQSKLLGHLHITFKDKAMHPHLSYEQYSLLSIHADIVLTQNDKGIEMICKKLCISSNDDDHIRFSFAPIKFARQATDEDIFAAIKALPKLSEIQMADNAHEMSPEQFGLFFKSLHPNPNTGLKNIKPRP